MQSLEPHTSAPWATRQGFSLCLRTLRRNNADAVPRGRIGARPRNSASPPTVRAAGRWGVILPASSVLVGIGDDRGNQDTRANSATFGSVAPDGCVDGRWYGPDPDSAHLDPDEFSGRTRPGTTPGHRGHKPRAGPASAPLAPGLSLGALSGRACHANGRVAEIVPKGGGGASLPENHE
jgi:hypothetical protein